MKVDIGPYNNSVIPEKRDINVIIEAYDTHEFDYTLALIILPALMQLKQNTKGMPISLQDIGGTNYENQLCFSFYQEDIDSASYNKKTQEWDTIMDKMIWSFIQIIEDRYKDLYSHGEPDLRFQMSDKKYHNPVTGLEEPTYDIVNKNEDYWYDTVGYEEHKKRIQEGLDLFAKYYTMLWDC